MRCCTSLRRCRRCARWRGTRRGRPTTPCARPRRSCSSTPRSPRATKFVKESVSFVYPDAGDAWIDETTTANESIAIVAPTLEGERMVDRFTSEGGTGVVLRFGSFYGPTARMVDEALRLARWRLSILAGKPDGYVSSIHTDDVAGAAVASLDAPAGVYNAVEDEPATRREYLDAFSAAFGLR